jgi:prephenate dehydratase
LHYCDEFEAVFDAVTNGTADAGIIPIENSLEGAVPQNLDLLLDRDVQICGELVLPVRHCLVGRGDISSVRVIVSHPQALAQCRGYLRRRFPDVELRTTGSTSHAARLAQEFPEMGAIAGASTAELYSLRILEHDIQDRSSNATRFAVISSEAASPTGRDKTSIAVYLDRDSPGALCGILSEFARRSINLTRIESRPSKLGLGDYYFFIDLEGHKEDLKVKESLQGVLRKAARVKVLGSYPKQKKAGETAQQGLLQP